MFLFCLFIIYKTSVVKLHEGLLLPWLFRCRNCSRSLKPVLSPPAQVLLSPLSHLTRTSALLISLASSRKRYVVCFVMTLNEKKKIDVFTFSYIYKKTRKSISSKTKNKEKMNFEDSKRR